MPIDVTTGFPITPEARQADRNAEHARRIAALERGGGGQQYLSALPSAPYDYQRILYSPATGTIWDLLYDPTVAGTSKWVYLGGAALTSYVSAASTRVTSASYGGPDTGTAPSVTVPLAGDYYLQHGARLFSPQNGQTAFANLSPGGGIAEVSTYVFGGGVTEFGQSVMGAATATGLAAAAVISQQYKGNAAAGSTQTIKWLSVLPVKVG